MGRLLQLARDLGICAGSYRFSVCHLRPPKRDKGFLIMGWKPTIAMLIARMALTLFHFAQGRRKKPFHVPLVPPTAVLFIRVLLIIIAGSHALTLMGIEHNRSQLRL
jgi:hypothetical protein